MRVSGSTNQARRWRTAWSAYFRAPVRRQAAASAGTCTLSRISARRCSTKLSGFVMPSRCT